MLRKPHWLLLALSAACVCVCGCGRGGSPTEALLKDLRQSPIMTLGPNGVGVFAQSPGVARSLAEESRTDGINLFAVYKNQAQDQEVAVQLAYLLLVEENSAYLDHARRHLADLTARHEFAVWVYLLDYESVFPYRKRVSPEFRDELLEILEGVDAPYARVASANHLWLKGERAQTAHRLLDVLSGDTEEMVWRGYAFRAFREMLPESERAACLLPYLKSNGLNGVYAAYVLGWTAEYRPSAVEYLRQISEGSDSELASLAESFLSLLDKRYGSTQ